MTDAEIKLEERPQVWAGRIARWEGNAERKEGLGPINNNMVSAISKIAEQSPKGAMRRSSQVLN